ncbi:baseplate J/gp47 family protein, partial [Photorhabdus sp. MH8.4]
QYIPKGTQVRTDDGVYFVTINDVTLTSESAKESVEAVLGGVSGNVGIGEINTIVGDLAGILTVTNELAFNNGIDEETDESLLQRVYDKVRKPATSGNIHHYE